MRNQHVMESFRSALDAFCAESPDSPPEDRPECEDCGFILGSRGNCPCCWGVFDGTDEDYEEDHVY